MERKLTVGLPKGSLEQSTLSLFNRAGLSFRGPERSLWLESSDSELKPVLLRPQEIPLYVVRGLLDCGIAGLDWITETVASESLHFLADFQYAKRSIRPWRWVLAVPQDSPWRKTQDLQASSSLRPLRISSQLKRISEHWLAERDIDSTVEFSWGATEAKAPIFVDAIVECTETGASLRANRLRILDVVFESPVHFFANKEAYDAFDWKRAKLDNLTILLRKGFPRRHRMTP